MAEENFQPKIVAFVCRWCTYTGADLAGMSRLQYPPNTKVIMLPCSGRIDINFVLRAFMQGADGVLVSGCHPGDCHYNEGNYRARRRWTLLRDLLDTLGFDLRRLKLAWISAAEGNKWAQTVTDFTKEITDLGPYTELHELCECVDSPLAPEEAIAEKMAFTESHPAEEALVKAVEKAFGEEKVAKVLGWRSRPTLKRTSPDWFENAAELKDLAAPPAGVHVVRLCDEPVLANEPKLGVIARPRELASLNVLTQEHALDPEQVTVFELDKDGKYLKTGTLQELSGEVAAAFPEGQVVGHSPETMQKLAEFMQKPREERFAFWKEVSQHCLHCYACRQACPICHCKKCYVEKNQPQWFPTAADGMGNLSWLIVRAFHLAGRCIGCGACQTACPADIPLNLLNAALAKSSLDNFAYQAGVDPAAPPLQANFSQKDQETFII